MIAGGLLLVFGTIAVAAGTKILKSIGLDIAKKLTKDD